MSQPWTHVSPHSPAYPRVDEHYVEPFWVSERLFDEEKFTGEIYDPACGFGRIVETARRRGYSADGADQTDRGYDYPTCDFFKDPTLRHNIVSNPPFDVFEQFTRYAVGHTLNKIALIMPTARLNAARWLDGMPLRCVWLLTPRPSMPPGHVITSGGKVGGGKSDYCWLVFERRYHGEPKLRWMHRDKP